MNFSLDIPALSIYGLTAAAAVAVVLLTLYRSRVASVARRVKECDSDSDAPQAAVPAVSVVVFCRDEAHELERLLPSVLSQRYDAPLEVIVVNEGGSEEVRELVSNMQLRHRNLYLTFTPDGARNLSRKKLALTLGIKAARHEVIALTTVDTVIDSDLWLARMCAHFAVQSTSVVIGYARTDTEADKAAGRRHRAFDYVADAVVWLSEAIGGKPYRGSEFNLAYRRDTFFANKGFSGSLNLRHGDDDVFVNEIASGANTAVELSADSIVTLDLPDQRRELRELAMRSSFTGKFLPRGPRVVMAACEWLTWLWLAGSIMAVAADYTNILTIALTAVVGIALWLVLALTWRSTLRSLRSRPLLLTVPWMVMTRPLRKAALSVRIRLSHRKNYTWD